MSSRLLIIIDWLAKPTYVILNAFKWREKKSEGSESFVVLKFFGIGSLTRIAKVIEQTNVPISAVTFITLQKNEALVDLLNLQAKYIKTANPFTFIFSAFKTILAVWKMKKCTVLDMERASNLSGIFRLIVSVGKPCVSFNFNSKNHATRSQQFISLHNKPAVKALAEMFGQSVEFTSNNLAISPVKNRIIINVNAGNYLPQRKFTFPEYSQMVNALAIKHPSWQFELSGLNSELQFVEAFKTKLIEDGMQANRVETIAGQHHLESFANRLKTAELFITNDSGPLHLAYYYGVKTVCIWGPTSPLLVGYENSSSMLNLATDISCSPCFINPKSRVAKACNGELTCFKSMIPAEMATKISSFVEVKSKEEN